MSTASQSERAPLLKSAAPQAPTSAATEQKKPSRFRMYWELNRLHKFPAGCDLILFPPAWALTMTAYRTKQPLHEYARQLIWLAILSILVHMAICIQNDICDRKFDRQERTKTRPLASGAISLGGAITCLLVETGILIGFLAYTQNTTVLLLGLFGLIPLHGLYPLMKRVTYWPQAWLGLAIGYGYIVIWALRMKDEHDYTIPIVIILGHACWTIVYDTIYACQDRVDDAKVGVKSTALLFGNYVRPILSVFAFAFVVTLAAAGYLNGQGLDYYVVSVGATAVHLTWQLVTFKEDDPEDCYKKFASNGVLGFVILAGMIPDYLRVMN